VIYLSIFAKSGVYANNADHHIVNELDTGTPPTLLRLNTEQDRSRVSTSVEVGVSVNIRFAECALFRGGYQILYVGNLALAPEQLDSNRDLFANTIQVNGNTTFPGAVSNVNGDGNILYRGLFLGLELCF
jgi:hypothetical protein